MHNIGLNKKESKATAQKLNTLLANYQVFYTNTKGFHWNIKGEKFFELHVKFEELYNDLFIKIDEIAERILTLGAVPNHTFTSYLKASHIKEVQNASTSKEIVTAILDSLETLIIAQRELLEMSAKSNDEGTNALMSDYIREQEKLVWMYSAYMGK